MRIVYVAAILFSCTCCFGSEVTENAAVRPSSVGKLIWQDDFDYPDAQLEDNWNAQNGPSGHILCSRWRENALVQDGTLRLINKKEKRGGQDWTSASLTSKREFQYGYFECRYRYANATGTNNSFWLMSRGKFEPMRPDAKRFEIDINEGHFPSEINMNIHNWSDVTNVDGKPRHFSAHKSFTPPNKPDLGKEFHLYGLLWTSEELVFFFDGQEIRREKNTFCHTPCPVWLSEAIIKWGGAVSDTIDQTYMEVDYVKVYKLR